MTDQEQANIVEAILGDKSFCPRCAQPCDAVISIVSTHRGPRVTLVGATTACQACWKTGFDYRQRSEFILNADRVDVVRGSKVSAIKDRCGTVGGDEVITDWL